MMDVVARTEEADTEDRVEVPTRVMSGTAEERLLGQSGARDFCRGCVSVLGPLSPAVTCDHHWRPLCLGSSTGKSCGRTSNVNRARRSQRRHQQRTVRITVQAPVSEPPQPQSLIVHVQHWC